MDRRAGATRRRTRSARWRPGTRASRYLGEHDVRFFEGFLARDAALLHTSDGQLETALTLFGTSIEAFLRSGAVAQLIITLASLPALFERLDRPGVARTLLGAMANEPASLHHVPDARRARRAARRHGSATRRRHGSPPPAARWTSTTPRRTPFTRSTSPGRRSRRRGSDGGLAGLTARETQVLRLIADGATTREISERLFISAKTADNHIQHIYTKLGVTNRAAATRWALDRDVVVRAEDAGAG